MFIIVHRPLDDQKWYTRYKSHKLDPERLTDLDWGHVFKFLTKLHVEKENIDLDLEKDFCKYFVDFDPE